MKIEECMFGNGLKVGWLKPFQYISAYSFIAHNLKLVESGQYLIEVEIEVSIYIFSKCLFVLNNTCRSSMKI
jgi:hypothetical protein